MNQEILKHIEQALALANGDLDLAILQHANADYEADKAAAVFSSKEEATDNGVYEDVVKKEAAWANCRRVVEKLEKLLSDLC